MGLVGLFIYRTKNHNTDKGSSKVYSSPTADRDLGFFHLYMPLLTALTKHLQVSRDEEYLKHLISCTF